jgi:hypothetical protein
MNNPQITVTITTPLMQYIDTHRDSDCRNTSDFVRRLLCEAVAHRSGKSPVVPKVKRGRPWPKKAVR